MTVSLIQEKGRNLCDAFPGGASVSAVAYDTQVFQGRVRDVTDGI